MTIQEKLVTEELTPQEMEQLLWKAADIMTRCWKLRGLRRSLRFSMCCITYVKHRMPVSV
jgi:hypothetical protein